MPSAMHPQAKFDPIPPDLDLNALVESTENFDYVPRISLKQIKELGIDDFEKVVLRHVIIGGKPLVIDGWETDLPPWLFSSTWLTENVGAKAEQVRDIGQSSDMPMTIGHYLKSMSQLTKNMNPQDFRDPKRQRLYLKDIDCPDAWYQKLEEIIPQQLFYYNKSVGEKGGLGAVNEKNSFGQIVLGKGIAPAGDLMSSLPPEMRAQNFMCYIGHEGTYTPAHREMCASLGQNIMVETSEEDSGEAPGSSIWFMTESKDREVVSEFFLSMLGHDIEIENHFAQINAWKKAPFPVYIVEQKVGDFILIPPLAPHQVWNRGTRTVKAAWNRTTVDTLELAINEALPRARLVCRDEQYKSKAIIYFTLQKYSHLLERFESEGGAMYDEYGQRGNQNPGRLKQLQRDFRRLFDLFTIIMLTEMFDPARPEKKVEFVKYDSNVTCSYCRCNIFNRFLTCKSCIITSDDGEIEDTYDICMECYAMGRSCACVSNLSWVEQWKWPELTFEQEKWRTQVVSILTSRAIDGQLDPDTAPPPLNVVRKRLEKTPVAQICQEQLKLRPFCDPSKPYVPEPVYGDSDNEPEVDDKGYLIKKKISKRKSDQRKKTHHSCHICRKVEENWKLAFCCECTLAYCYGVLYRAFDLMPQTIMEQADWKCPKCLKICSCARCRRDPRQKPYQLKGTLLGHDTKKVADERSIESLVDFGRTNLPWLRGEGEDDPGSSQRMKNLVDKAIENKAREDQAGEPLNDAVGEDDSLYANSNEGQIDPRLGGGAVKPPVVPMYANAYPEAGLLDHDAGPAYDRYGINAHPERGYPDHSLYPELPDFEGRERVMGAGYYLQKAGPEAILYNDPNASPLDEPAADNADMAYPKLPPKEPEIVYANQGVKRKRASTAKSTPRANGGVNGDAHTEFVQAQKKQKLVDARANDKFLMTQHQLDGGDPLIVKLRVPQDFLHSLRSPVKKTRPTRASLRIAEDEENMINSLNIVKSDVQPIVVNSDDEFDLALQAMNSLIAAKTESSTRGFAKTKTRGTAKSRGSARTRGTRGTAKPVERKRRGSSEEGNSQISNGASINSGRRARRQSTESFDQEENDDDEIDFAGRLGHRRQKSARDVEEDYVPSAAVKRATRRRKSTDDDSSDADKVSRRPAGKRPAGKRPSRASKFGAVAGNDHEDLSDAEELQVVKKAVPKAASKAAPKEAAPKIQKRRGRPPRQTKSLGVANIEEESIAQASKQPANRRKSAPVTKMVAEVAEEEIPDSQEVLNFTNHSTPLNRREIGGRRPDVWPTQDNEVLASSMNGRSAAQTRRSVRFEDTPYDDDVSTHDSAPLRFANFGESDSRSLEPIDYSIFEDRDTVLEDGDEDMNGGTFPRGSQHLDEDGDVEMAHEEIEPSIPVEEPIQAKSKSKPKPKRGRPARPVQSSISIVIEDDDERISQRSNNIQRVTSGPALRTVSSAPALTEESDHERSSPIQESAQEANQVPWSSASTLAMEGAEPDADSVQEFESANQDIRSPTESIRSPTPLIQSAKSKGKAKAVSPVEPPAKAMTEEERIIEENRRAKQAILAKLRNDGYSDDDDDYYSASENGETEPEPERRQAGNSAAQPIIADAQDDDDVNSISPYFAKPSRTSFTTASGTTTFSAVARKFARSVAAAGKQAKRRQSGIAIESAVDNPLPSLAEKRALAGKKTKVAVMSVNEVVKNKFGKVVKKDVSRSASSSAARSLGSSSVVSKGASGEKRAPGILGSVSPRSIVNGGKEGQLQDSDDDDDSDTSIPAVRPVAGMARRGGSFGLLQGTRGIGAGSPRGRGRAKK